MNQQPGLQPGSAVDEHGGPSLPSVVQYVWPCFGHDVAPQSPDAHATSHAHEFSQETLPHADAAEQVTLHLPVPQLIAPQADAAEHVTSHAELAQSIEPHAFDMLHVIAHAKPAGHVIAAPVCPVTLHSGGDIARSQLVQGAGQFDPTASATPVTQ